MKSRKARLLQKYLEKKSRQKERDGLLEKLRELQKKSNVNSANKSIHSSSQLRRKTEKVKVRKAEKPSVDGRTVSPVVIKESLSNTESSAVIEESEKNESIQPITAPPIQLIQPIQLIKTPSITAPPIKTLKSLSRTRNRKDLQQLPIEYMEDEIVSSVKERFITIISGGTGTGKSTQVPQFLYENGFSERGKICLTQPRRVSAKAIANRISYEQGKEIGTLCGYRMRYESCVSEETEIVVVTEGVLLQELAEDPLLSKYSVVIIDEVHERSLAQDTLAAVLSKVSTKTKMRLVLMSAGVSEEYRSSLSAMTNTKIPIIEIDSLAHEVQIHYLPMQIGSYSYLQEMQKRIFQLRKEKGSILAFVATKEETYLLKESLALINRPVYLLHSDTLPSEQDEILKSKRALIIATNAAETSLTLPDVFYIVDGGREVQRVYSYKENAYKHEKKLISKSSAMQRKGRAGRVGKGVCYRIYTVVEYEQMEEERVPAVKSERVLPIVSALIKAGVHPSRIDRVKYITPPSDEALKKETEELKRLSIISDKGLTLFGYQALSLPISPALASAILQEIHSNNNNNTNNNRLPLNLISLSALIEVTDGTYKKPKTLANNSNQTNQISLPYISILSQFHSSRTLSRSKTLYNHICKCLNRILDESSSNNNNNSNNSNNSNNNNNTQFKLPEERKEIEECAQPLSHSFFSCLITAYKGKYYYNGEEVSLGEYLPCKFSEDKPTPIVSHSAVIVERERFNLSTNSANSTKRIYLHSPIVLSPLKK